MVLKQEVIDAFTTLGLDPTVEQSIATTAYKKLALKHHPDRNFGDLSANERFQEIGQAWAVCQHHFEYPASSQVPEPGSRGFGNFSTGRTYTSEDEVPLDEYEAAEFFRFMFEEMMFNRFSHSKGQRYRRERAGDYGGGVYTFSGGFAESQQRQADNAARQKKENEEYKQRVREFEREQAKEEAENKRRAQEEYKDQSRFASAQDRAFQLGKEGKWSEMRGMVEKFDLDVKKPRKINVPKKGSKPANSSKFETMLHVAAASCDVSLVEWLLSRDADPAALDTSSLTPFHIAVSHGNTPVARHFISLYRNTKSTDPRYQSFCDGCHPSKAAKNAEGSTPLQLAIKSGKVDMVELMLKDATVHNVEKCWGQLVDGQKSEEFMREVEEILLTKNGFAPDDGVGSQSMSKKAARKLKQIEEEKKASEEKARRLAEEEENRLRKQARREKAAKEEAERQARRKGEESRLEAERKEQQRRQQAEDEERARKEFARQEAEARQVVKREAEAREAKRRQKEKEAAAKQKAKEATAKRKEMEAALARRAEAEAEAVRIAQREAEIKRQEEERIKAERRRAIQEREEQLQRDRDRKEAEAEARKKQELEDIIKMEEAQRALKQKEADQARQDAIMRRRAEQSARDKARNQRLREERAKAKAQESDIAPPTPSTPTSKGALLRADQTTPTATKARRPKASSSRAPAPSGPPQTRTETYTPVVPVAQLQPILLSPPMTPEDLQTIPIPDDLFRYEPPVLVKESAPPSPPSTSPSLRGQTTRGRGRSRGTVRRDAFSPASSPGGATDTPHIGNGVPCRFMTKRGGCARGAQCAFSHTRAPQGRRTALEEELARKNLELERMRAELAAARAGVQ